MKRRDFLDQELLKKLEQEFGIKQPFAALERSDDS